MIARVWRGRTMAADADIYVEYVRETGVSAHRATAGNVGSMILRREEGDEVEFLVVSFWKSMEDVRGFAGEDPEVAVYYPEDEKYLLHFEPTVRHYDVPLSEFD